MRTVSLIYLLLIACCSSAMAAPDLKQAPSGWVLDEPELSGTRVVPVAPTIQRSKSAPKLMLQGGVQHSQELPALPKAFSIGSTYNERALAGSASGADGWYWIPAWLAGDWRRDQETIVHRYNYDSGQQNNEPQIIQAIELAQYGVQRDRNGGVWHCRLAANGRADCGSYVSVALVQSQEPMLVSPARVVIRDVFTELHVNKDTNAIIYSAQAESLTTYEPIQDGVLRVTSSVKVFDGNGMPKSEQENVSTTMRTKTFAPLDSYKGQDLKDAFKKFLIANDKSDFVP